MRQGRGTQGHERSEPDRQRKIKTRVKTGGTMHNHNETQAPAKTSLPVKTRVKAGGILRNHNETPGRSGQDGVAMRCWSAPTQ
jgi:hypothetical protein